MPAIKGLRKYKEGKIEVLLRIIDELSADYGDEIPVTLVIDKAIEEGVEDLENKLKFLAKHLTIIYTSPTTFKKTWPDNLISK